MDNLSRSHREKLLISRDYRGGWEDQDKWAIDEMSQYEVGDLYKHSYSTTSPPAFVYEVYEVIRKDKEGLWGILVDSSFREMTAEEVM